MSYDVAEGPIKSFETRNLEADFCVVGGGMAGVCAALAAARNGAKTILIQDRPVLGGNASSEIRMWICGAHGSDNTETGILEELFLDNYYRNTKLLFTVWDHVLYGKCQAEKNLTLLLNCSVNDVTTNGNKIESVKAWHLTQQCYFNVSAKLFSDCSGDSVLRICGAEYRWGREGKDEFDECHGPDVADRKTMGNSILIQLRETDTHVPFIPPEWAYKYSEEDLPNRGLSPTGNNFWWLEIGGVKDTIKDADEIRDELFKIAYGVWDLIKNHPDGRGHKWELDWIGSLPGKRENVRYVGDHILCQKEVEAEGHFDDMVAYGGWSMDDHHPEAIEYPGKPTIFHPAPSPYGIPYRCLYSKNIDNLMFAGRNISATHMAMSSTRVMATTAIMGQAVGTAAAIAIANDLSPRGVYEEKIADLQGLLLDQDCYLPWHPRELPELSKQAELTASTGDPAAIKNGVERILGDEDNGWWGSASDSLSYTWSEAVSANTIRIVFDSDLATKKKMLCCYPKDLEPAKMPGMLGRDFDVELQGEDGTWQTVAEVRDNIRRLVTVDLAGANTKGCRLKLVNSWDGDKTHVMSFDVC